MLFSFFVHAFHSLFVVPLSLSLSLSSFHSLFARYASDVKRKRMYTAAQNEPHWFNQVRPTIDYKRRRIDGMMKEAIALHAHWLEQALFLFKRTCETADLVGWNDMSFSDRQQLCLISRCLPRNVSNGTLTCIWTTLKMFCQAKPVFAAKGGELLFKSCDMTTLSDSRLRLHIASVAARLEFAPLNTDSSFIATLKNQRQEDDAANILMEMSRDYNRQMIVQ
jgi:hypothetical protein